MAIIFSILMSLGIISNPSNNNQNLGTNGNFHQQNDDQGSYRWDADIMQ